VLLRNEDVGHGGLARHLAEGALDRGTVVYSQCVSLISSQLSCMAFSTASPSSIPRVPDTHTRACVLGYIFSDFRPRVLRTNLIQLNRIKLCAALAQQLLRLATVRAVALAEDGDGVLVNDALDLGLGGGHGGGRGGAREVAAQEGNGCGVWLKD
jgi:hypothetical protein